MTKCLIECLITYFYYLTDDYVVCLFCHLSGVYRELLEPSLINRVLILHSQFNNFFCPWLTRILLFGESLLELVVP